MSVLFCTPCYGGMLTSAHYLSSMRMKEALTQLGVEHDWLVSWNESLVHRARMEMTATFLKTDHTHMFWLDADIEFTPEDLAKVWNMQADIGVGVYRMKKPESVYAAWKDGKLVTDLDQFGDKPIEVELAGTGFMCIKREVIEKLAETAPSYMGQNGRVPAIYLTPIVNDTLESEDYHFCRIAREAGYKIMMDPTVRLGHWGLCRYGT